MAILAPVIPFVTAGNYATQRTQILNLSLLVVLGGDANAEPEEALDLSLIIAEYGVTTSTLDEAVGLSVAVLSGESGFTSRWVPTPLGLVLDFAVGSEVDLWRIVWIWDPFDQPKFTATNYTYSCSLTKDGVEQVGYDVAIRYEGVLIAEKTSNASGVFEYWAIVSSPGWHVWDFSVYDNGTYQVTIFKDTEYVAAGPPGPDDGDGVPELPDDWFPDEPIEGLGFLADWLPLGFVVGFFGFVGMTLVGGYTGLLIGGVAGLVVTVILGSAPMYLLFFVLLVALLVIVYRLKRGGGSTVVMENGGGA